MAYTKQYTKTTWVNNSPPAINANNLNNIEDGIDAVDTGLAAVSGDVEDVETALGAKADNTTVGSLSNLTTTAKTDIVSAINEVDADIASEATARANAVSGEATARANADNTINGKIGNLANLETTEKSTIVGAINETKSNTDALASDMEENYAQIDGYYDEMAVGSAEQLISTVLTEDSAPYKFRTTGGSADVGNREYVDKIVGGTIAWNQLVKNNDKNFSTANGWSTRDASFSVSGGVASLTASAQYGRIAYNFPNMSGAGHKYLVMADVYGSTDNYLWFSNVKSVYLTANNTWQTLGFVATTTTEIWPSLNVTDRRASGWTEFKVKNVNTFDLTQMFGTAVADAVYAMEQSQAGSGVAWFKAMFPEPYYEYNAGELMSVEGLSAHEMVGFNAYNPTTGTAKVLGGHQYQIAGAYTALSLDGTALTPDSNGFFTPSANGTLTVTGGNDSTTCVHLVWSGYRNGEYEAYKKHSYALDSSLTLRGIPKWADGEMYYDGDTYESDGTVTRKYGIVDLGTLTWTYYTSGTNPILYAEPTNHRAYARNEVVNAINPKYPIGYPANERAIMTESLPDKTCSLFYGANGAFVVRDSAYTSASAFKTAMSGVYLVYELATATTETAEPFQNPQIVDDFGTEEYVSTNLVPVGHTTKYPENLRAKIEGLPWDFSTLIAPTEKTYKATRNYTTGNLLIVNNVLYKATANIANGGTITPNTNVTATTLAEIIAAL